MSPVGRFVSFEASSKLKATPAPKPRPTSRFLGGKKAMCRGGGSRAQRLVRAGVVPTTPRSVSRKSPARDGSSFGCVVQTRQVLFGFIPDYITINKSTIQQGSLLKTGSNATIKLESPTLQPGMCGSSPQGTIRAPETARATATARGGTWGWPYKGNSLLSHSLINTPICATEGEQ